MRTILKFTSIAMVLLLNSCSSGGDSNSDPNPNPDPNPTTITYTNTISGIISSNCISCHGSTPTNGATISLNTYTKVMSNGETIIQRISLPQGDPSMMPKDGTRLPLATIQKFTTWKNNGYPE